MASIHTGSKPRVLAPKTREFPLPPTYTNRATGASKSISPRAGRGEGFRIPNLMSQRCVYGGGEFRCLGRSARAKRASNRSVAAEQIFVEIPFWRRIFAKFFGQPFVERMRCGTDHLLLRGQGKIDCIPRLAKIPDFTFRARL